MSGHRTQNWTALDAATIIRVDLRKYEAALPTLLFSQLWKVQDYVTTIRIYKFVKKSNSFPRQAERLFPTENYEMSARISQISS